MDRKSVLGPWKQGIYDTSVTPTEIVGTLREDLNGNRYRYARAGAVALAANLQTTAAAINADYTNQACAAHSVGDTTLVLAIADPGTDPINTADYLRGGQIVMTDGTAEGIRYSILYSSAVASGATAITITIDKGLVEAITSATEFTLVPSPYMLTVISATATHRAAGVPIVDVTAYYYYWSQTAGEGIALGMDTTAAGQWLTLGTTDGSLSAWTGSLTVSGAVVTVGQPSLALVTGTAMVDGEFTPVCYQID